MRAAQREWLVRAEPSQGRARKRSTSPPAAHTREECAARRSYHRRPLLANSAPAGVG
jgi:hypothetical protein